MLAAPDAEFTGAGDNARYGSPFELARNFRPHHQNETGKQKAN
jgi:hypothetical protein